MRFSLLFFFLLAGLLVAADPTVPPAAPATNAADQKPSAFGPGSDFDIPVPQGIPAHGIKIPH